MINQKMNNKKYPKIIVKRFFSDKGSLAKSFVNVASRRIDDETDIANYKADIANNSELCYNNFDVVCCKNKED